MIKGELYFDLHGCMIPYRKPQYILITFDRIHGVRKIAKWTFDLEKVLLLVVQKPILQILIDFLYELLVFL